jgi:hypothetical protein
VSAHSRKRGRRTRTPAPRAGRTAVQSPEPHRSRSEQRNEQIRAGLIPLAPGERPWPLRVAIVVAVLIGVGNIVQAAVGTHIKVGGTRAGLGGAVIFGLVMLVCAVGMWRLRYWAVLGFEALLALIVVAFSLVLLTAGDILRALIALLVIVAGGYLFYKLVRVLSRLQMPRPQGRA